MSTHRNVGSTEQQTRLGGLVALMNMYRTEIEEGGKYKVPEVLLDKLAGVLVRIGKYELTLGGSFEVYSGLSDLLMAAEYSLKVLDTSHSKSADELYEGLYEYTLGIPQLVPRVFLQILIGGVILDNASPNFERLRILRDISTCTRGVQHLIKGIFVRYYLVQTIGRRLTNMHLEPEREGGDSYCKITTHSASKFLAIHFAELATSFFDLRIFGPITSTRRCNEWNQISTLVLSSVLQQLSNLEGLDPHTFLHDVWPYICEPLLRCSAIVDALGGPSMSENPETRRMMLLYSPQESVNPDTSIGGAEDKSGYRTLEQDVPSIVAQYQADILRYVARVFSEDICITALPPLLCILPGLSERVNTEKVLVEMLLKIERYLVREDMRDTVTKLLTDNWDPGLIAWAEREDSGNILGRFYLTALGYMRRLGVASPDLEATNTLRLVIPLIDSALRLLKCTPDLCLKILGASYDLISNEMDRCNISATTPGSPMASLLSTFMELPMCSLLIRTVSYPELAKNGERLNLLDVLVLPQFTALASRMAISDFRQLSLLSFSCILMPCNTRRIEREETLDALESLLAVALSSESGSPGPAILQLLEIRNLTPESPFPALYDRLFSIISPHVSSGSLHLTAALLLIRAASQLPATSPLLTQIISRLHSLNISRIEGIKSGPIIATLCRAARVFGARKEESEFIDFAGKCLEEAVGMLEGGMDASLASIVNAIVTVPLSVEKKAKLRESLLTHIKTLDIRERVLPLSQLLILAIKDGDIDAVVSIVDEGTKELEKEGDANAVLESVCTVLMLLSKLSEAMVTLPQDAPSNAGAVLSELALDLSKTCVEMMEILEEEDGVGFLGVSVAHVCRLYEVAQKTLEELRDKDSRFISLAKEKSG